MGKGHTHSDRQFREKNGEGRMVSRSSGAPEGLSPIFWAVTLNHCSPGHGGGTDKLDSEPSSTTCRGS